MCTVLSTEYSYAIYPGVSYTSTEYMYSRSTCTVRTRTNTDCTLHWVSSLTEEFYDTLMYRILVRYSYSSTCTGQALIVL